MAVKSIRKKMKTYKLFLAALIAASTISSVDLSALKMNLHPGSSWGLAGIGLGLAAVWCAKGSADNATKVNRETADCSPMAKELDAMIVAFKRDGTCPDEKRAIEIDIDHCK